MEFDTIVKSPDELKRENLITPERLQELGFKAFENGQFELQKEEHVYLCFFRSEYVVSLKRLSKNTMFNPIYGYLQMQVDDKISSLDKLIRLIADEPIRPAWG